MGNDDKNKTTNSPRSLSGYSKRGTQSSPCDRLLQLIRADSEENEFLEFLLFWKSLVKELKIGPSNFRQFFSPQFL